MEEQGRLNNMSNSNGFVPHFGGMLSGGPRHSPTLIGQPPRTTPPKKSYSIDSILGDIVNNRSRRDTQFEATSNPTATPPGNHSDHMYRGMSYNSLSNY